MPFIGQQPQSGAYSALDSITTSATDTYNLTLDGSAYYPQSANQLLVSLNGVLQAPNTSYNVSGSQIVFSSALTSSDVIDFITALGNTYDIGTPTDGTVSAAKIATGAVTSAKLDTNIDIAGTLDVTGALTADSNATVAGTLDVTGTLTADSNATVAGNLTVDTDTLYVDSANNRVGIGTSSPSRTFVVNGTSQVMQRIINNNTQTILSLENSGTTGENYVSVVSQNNDMYFRAGGGERVRIDSSGNLKFNSGYGSVATAYGCRAWVNFNGTGTVAIRASGNVSSITDNGTGNYTVNFTTAMPDSSYAAQATSSITADWQWASTGSFQTTSVQLQSIRNSGGSGADSDTISVNIFR